MESDRNLRNSYNYSNLFNLESLTKFQLPQGDEFDYYANSSQGESRAGGPMTDRSNGMMSEKRKRRNMYSSDEDQDDISDTYFSEEQYRAMLGEHVHKYKRRHKTNNLPTSASTRNGKSSLGSKDHKIANGRQGGGARKIETIPQNLGHYKESDFAQELVSEPGYLDIGDGITYKIPPTYEMLATSLNLPRTPEIRVEEFYLTGTLDLGSLASMMSADKRLGPRGGSGMGEPKTQYESLWARLSSPNSPQKFSLKVSDEALDSYSAPEGAAGGFRRSIMSESGVLQVFYVKVLEKGDTYEIIERSLPKKEKEKKDPSMIEREEMDKVEKYWVNMVRKDIPKHHRFFINFHRKQLTDAKRFSENCQREVKMKVSRSLKLMRGASIRTRKLARDMLVFWKRVDKEMVIFLYFSLLVITANMNLIKKIERYSLTPMNDLLVYKELYSVVPTA